MSALDSTISSTTSNAIAALSGLSTRDVRIIDDIIRRVPDATTFPTMFKAYNAVLQEHGLDATNDVVYYKILLKVGVVKGPNWGSRWEMAKEQLGYDDMADQTASEAEEEEETPVKGKAPARVTYTARLPQFNASPGRLAPRTKHQGHMYIDPEDESAASERDHDHDSFTVHSHREDEETTTTDGDATEDGTSEGSPTTLVQPAPVRATGRNALHLQTGPSSYPPLPSITEFLPVQAKKTQHSRKDTHDPINERPLSRAEETPRATNSRQVQRDFPITNDGMRAALVPKAANNSKAPLPVHDEDTWRKIKVQRDEKEADRFREIILLERYFHLWTDGLCWIKVRYRKQMHHIMLTIPPER